MAADELRIGDAEREHTMAALREHYALGRLTHEEFEERLDQTLAAKTSGDLAAVSADLPGESRDTHGYREPAPQQWHDYMGDHRQMHLAHRQMRHEMHLKMREERRAWAQRRHHGHRGPGPLPFLLIIGLVFGIAFGGFAVLKVLFFVWIAAMVFGAIHRRHHYRRSTP